ncbi:MAG: hypothetical protein FJ045_00190 [Crenarchaeota archaeon]|nr:hypothetical protein [Thermoproteota archaeon]
MDYLRIYSFKLENNRVRKPAEEQYVALQGSLDPIRSLEAQAHVAYIRRTVGDVPLKNLFVDFQKVIRGIWMMLDENQDEAQRRTLQQLLGWTIHQYGVVLQNAGAHIAAESTLQKAVEIRRLLGDAEIAHSVFLRFMNGVQAFKNGVGEVDDFAPRGWRLWLVRFLEKNSDSFRYAHDPENHGNTIHNVAFVHQFLAEEHERNMRFNEAYTEFCQALKLYEEAKDIRQDLRDPRMIAQSNVRIAQCKLWLACHERRNGNYDKARQLVEDADQLAREVSELYDRMPQESFRLDDVKEIQKKAERLRQEHLKK